MMKRVAILAEKEIAKLLSIYTRSYEHNILKYEIKFIDDLQLSINFWLDQELKSKDESMPLAKSQAIAPTKKGVNINNIKKAQPVSFDAPFVDF